MNFDQLKIVENAIAFAESSLTEPVTVVDICSVSPQSVWLFQRVFRAYTGSSIGEYIRARRLSEAARELIEDKNIRVLDIAVKYQFGSQEAFSRAFKKIFGLTPGEARSKPNEIRLFRRAKLSQEQLLHNIDGISREPKIEDWAERSFVGLAIEITSPFSEDKTYASDVTDLWFKFNPRRKQISNRIKGVGYGLVLSPSALMTEDKLEYVAVTEISDQEAVLPDDMKRYRLPAQTYACFEKRGLADKTKMSIDYIYGFWLPTSDFIRDVGYDVEIFDHRTRLDRNESVSIYCVPVRPKD